MKTTRWTRLEFHLGEAYQDLLVGQLAVMGFEGFTQDGQVLHAYIPTQAWNEKSQIALDARLAAFRSSFPDADTSFAVSGVPLENWNRRWEQSSGIVEATERILIKPSWKKLRKKDRGKIILHIDPKMSFGTGHHETTRLSLRLLESYVFEGARILDFGCGTGVLAIGAIKLGARTADAVDIDEWAILNARENIRRNRCADKIRVRASGRRPLPQKHYDLIVSNTDVPTLTSKMTSFLRALKPAGALLVSGLLTSDLESFLAVMAQYSLSPLEILSENEWIALSFLSPDAPRRN
jgi:ribosomal protein L11 methyltransferase